MHALLLACNVFNILPLEDLVTANGTVTTPFELFVGSKPMVSHFSVFGCPCIAKSGQSQWMASLKITARAPREELGEYTLDFLQPRKDCYFTFVPSTRQIVISGDVIWDETFASTVAETWKPFHDALVLRPIASFITDYN